MQQNVAMNSPKSDPKVPVACWGESIEGPINDWSCSLLEFHQERPIWRQANFRFLEEDPEEPLRMALDKMLPGWQETLKKSPPLELYVGPPPANRPASTRLSVGTDQMAGAAPPADSEAVDLAIRLAELGYLAADLLQWNTAQRQYALIESWEYLPVSLKSPGDRQERRVDLKESVRRITRIKVRQPKAQVLRTASLKMKMTKVQEDQICSQETRLEDREGDLAGRMIWEPDPFLVLHKNRELESWILEGSGMVCLQEVQVQEDENLVLTPKPWGRVELLAPRVFLKGRIPLEAIGGLPNLERLANNSEAVKGTHYSMVFQAFLNAMAPQYRSHGSIRFWVVAPNP
jgi:hypothetical protein